MKSKSYFIVLLLLTSCTHLISQPRIKFIGKQEFKTGEKFKDIEIGGLSGITYDHKNKAFFAISDDQGDFGPIRIFEFKLTDQFNLVPTKVILLKDRFKKPIKKLTMDCEGIAIKDNGHFLISSEGKFFKSKRIPPGIFEFDKNGVMVKKVKIPSYLMPEQQGIQTIGVRDNFALESLTRSANNGKIFFSHEQPLIQDAPIVSLKEGGPVRIFEMSSDFQLLKQYIYQIDPIPNPTNNPMLIGDNGLVDIEILPNNHLLTLERSWSPTTKENHIKIFKTQLQGGININVNSLKGRHFKPISKKLLYDLSNLNIKLDNIEGLALGPKLKDNTTLLVLISDNNFNRFQKTLIIFLKLEQL